MVSLLNICLCTDTGHSPRHVPLSIMMLGVTMTNHLFAGERSAMSSASARSPSMPWNCCTAMAWVTTRWLTCTNRRPLHAIIIVRLTGMVGLYQRGRQATSRSNSTTCHLARPLYSLRSYDVPTRCWHGRQSFCELTEQSLSCFVYKLLPNDTEHAYNLRPRRHSITNC